MITNDLWLALLAGAVLYNVLQALRPEDAREPWRIAAQFVAAIGAAALAYGLLSR